jgi:hypothetical protein
VEHVRRSIALIVMALVATLLPIGQPSAVAGDPHPVEDASPTPAPTMSPATPEPSATPAPASAHPSETPVAPSASPPPEPPVQPSLAVVPDVAPTAGPADPQGPVVDLTSTTIYMNGVPDPGVVNQQSTIQVILWPVPDGGTVSLLVDGIVVSTQEAIVTYPNLYWTPSSVGTHEVVATFDGTAQFAASSSSISTVQVIPPYPTSVVMTAAPDPVVRNEPVQLEATVTPDPGVGNVEFWMDGIGPEDGGTLIGTGGLVAGSTSVAATISAVGTHTIWARFAGNADWSPKLSEFTHLRVDGDVMSASVALASDPNPAGPTTATVTLSSDPGGGVIRWSWYADDYAATEVPVGTGGVTTLNLGSLPAGTYHLYVHFLGNGTFGAAQTDLQFLTKNPSTIVASANRTMATAGELPVVLSATVTTGNEEGRTISFLDDVGGVVVTLATLPVDPYSNSVTYSSNKLRVGVHSIRARYNGTTWTLPSTSAPLAVTVARDTAVHATFKTSVPTFYAYKDGFRDTVALAGVLDEGATITIRAYNSSGTLKRTWSLGTRKAGKYSVTWNGRTSGGTALPAGRYRVKASFKDARGNTRSITGYTTISWRQATWKTATTVTRYGDQLSYYATVDGHLYYSPDYSRGRTMFSEYINSYCSPDCIEIYGTTSFSFTSTALDYRSAVITVYGHGYEDYNSGTVFLVNPTTGGWSSRGAAPEYVSKISYSVPRSYISSTRKARIVIWCTEDMGDAVDIHYLKLTYQYAVWK